MQGAPLDVGELDRMVRIEQPVVTKDAATGAEVKTWSEVATVWAKVDEQAIPLEVMKSEVASYQRPDMIWIRWRGDVVETYRLVLIDTGRILQIKGTARLGRKHWLEIAAQEWAHE